MTTKLLVIFVFEAGGGTIRCEVHRYFLLCAGFLQSLQQSNCKLIKVKKLHTRKHNNFLSVLELGCIGVDVGNLL